MAESDNGGADRVLDALVSALHAADDGMDALARVCRVGLERLPVDGVSISLIVGARQGETLYVSNDVISRIETMQFSLGEGPCFEAFETRRPVLVADLAANAAAGWPVLASEMSGDQVAAFFAFPLIRGGITLGAMGLYRDRPGPLSAPEVATALHVADVATLALIALRLDVEDNEFWTELPTNRAQVNQAIGMLISALDLSAEHALARMRGYAFANGHLVDKIADDLVNRRLDPSTLDQP